MYTSLHIGGWHNGYSSAMENVGLTIIFHSKKVFIVIIKQDTVVFLPFIAGINDWSDYCLKASSREEASSLQLTNFDLAIVPMTLTCGLDNCI